MRTVSLLLCLSLAACAGTRAGEGPSSTTRAKLGIRTAAPSEEQAEALALPFKVRQQCRVVESVSEPAASAGVRAGDVLFAAGEVDLYSQDDLDDVVRVEDDYGRAG